jgi:hypothetical protein
MNINPLCFYNFGCLFFAKMNHRFKLRIHSAKQYVKVTCLKKKQKTKYETEESEISRWTNGSFQHRPRSNFNS